MSKTQEQIAREWAENRMSIKGFVDNPTLEAVAEVVMRHTKPVTMRDVVWDPKIHRGLGATDGYGNEWVMLKWNEAERIVCVTPGLEKVHNIARFNLTPNRKRYELVEETDRPKVLNSESDYKSAPVGTIVCHSDFLEPMVKIADNNWRYISEGNTDRSMASCEREVLRWGKFKNRRSNHAR